MNKIKYAFVTDVLDMTVDEFIDWLSLNHEDLSCGDVQGVVSARCLQTGEDDEEILGKIYEKIENE